MSFEEEMKRRKKFSCYVIMLSAIAAILLVEMACVGIINVQKSCSYSTLSYPASNTRDNVEERSRSDKSEPKSLSPDAVASKPENTKKIEQKINKIPEVKVTNSRINQPPQPIKGALEIAPSATAEESIRCGARYLGCFCIAPGTPRFEDEYKPGIKAKSIKECFSFCARRRFAAISDEECICGTKLPRGVELETSNNCARKSVKYEDDNCKKSSRSAELYRITERCKKGDVTEEELSSRFVGKFEASKNFNKETVVSRIHVTNASCFLHCDVTDHPLAMMKDDVCHCGQTTKEFRLNNPIVGDGVRTVAVWRTYATDYRCISRTFLPRNSFQNPVHLRSFPGSGNTWTRFLIESATGIFTGSVYREPSLQVGGFLGEYDQPESGRTLAIKNHKMTATSHKTIALIRNPYDAFMSEYTRRALRSQISRDVAIFTTPRWRENLADMTEKWLELNLSYLKDNDPVLVVYFEDLKLNYMKEIRRIVDFIGYEVKDVEERLLCLESEGTGLFKRKPKNNTFNPYTDQQAKLINHKINSFKEFISTRDGSIHMPIYEKDLKT